MFTQNQVRHRPSEISPQVGQIFFTTAPYMVDQSKARISFTEFASKSWTCMRSLHVLEHYKLF